MLQIILSVPAWYGLRFLGINPWLGVLGLIVIPMALLCLRVLINGRRQMTTGIPYLTQDQGLFKRRVLLVSGLAIWIMAIIGVYSWF